MDHWTNHLEPKIDFARSRISFSWVFENIAPVIHDFIFLAMTNGTIHNLNIWSPPRRSEHRGWKEQKYSSSLNNPSLLIPTSKMSISNVLWFIYTHRTLRGLLAIHHLFIPSMQWASNARLPVSAHSLSSFTSKCVLNLGQ